MKIGSWIGGDRDGNPFVTAEVMEEALKMQCNRALCFYLEELHKLASQLSVAQAMVKCSDELVAWQIVLQTTFRTAPTNPIVAPYTGFTRAYARPSVV